MKTDHNLVWSEVHEDKSITIGFTKKCIDELLPECFHVMQADSSAVRERGPMLVLETNDGLESIKSPFTGKISYFNSKARNYPDKLVETDTILTLIPPGVEKPKPVTAAKPKIQWNQEFMVMDNAFVPPPPLENQVAAAEELRQRIAARQPQLTDEQRVEQRRQLIRQLERQARRNLAQPR